jgi:diaminopimelate decarboxylase
MKRLSLFPCTTKIENDILTIAGQDIASLAGKYGTPLDIYDQGTMDNAVTIYKDALVSFYSHSASPPCGASVTYAGKAYLCTAIAQWTQHHDLRLDCTGESEIGTAKAGGVPRERILVHGVNKSYRDIKSTKEHAGTIVVDNLSELSRLADKFPNSNFRTYGSACNQAWPSTHMATRRPDSTIPNLAWMGKN